MDSNGGQEVTKEDLTAGKKVLQQLPSTKHGRFSPQGVTIAGDEHTYSRQAT